MKITEITEGWGQYSNKSNHRMNKFKRDDEVDEAEFGQWLSAKGKDAMGAVGRGLERGASAIGAKMGSGKAQGAQKVQQATMGVYRNFQRYLGQSNSKPTVAALTQYLKALGMDQVEIMEDRAAMLAKNKARLAAPAKAKPVTPDVKNAKGFQGTQGADPQKVLSKNEIMSYIQKNIQKAVQTGTLPKEIQKFLGQ